MLIKYSIILIWLILNHYHFIKRLIILLQMEHHYFVSPREKIKAWVSKIEHLKDIVKMLRNLKVKRVERKDIGEIMTPLMNLQDLWLI